MTERVVPLRWPAGSYNDPGVVIIRISLCRFSSEWPGAVAILRDSLFRFFSERPGGVLILGDSRFRLSLVWPGRSYSDQEGGPFRMTSWNDPGVVIIRISLCRLSSEGPGAVVILRGSLFRFFSELPGGVVILGDSLLDSFQNGQAGGHHRKQSL